MIVLRRCEHMGDYAALLFEPARSRRGQVGVGTYTVILVIDGDEITILATRDMGAAHEAYDGAADDIRALAP